MFDMAGGGNAILEKVLGSMENKNIILQAVSA